MLKGISFWYGKFPRKYVVIIELTESGFIPKYHNYIQSAYKISIFNFVCNSQNKYIFKKQKILCETRLNRYLIVKNRTFSFQMLCTASWSIVLHIMLLKHKNLLILKIKLPSFLKFIITAKITIFFSWIILKLICWFVCFW